MSISPDFAHSSGLTGFSSMRVSIPLGSTRKPSTVVCIVPQRPTIPYGCIVERGVGYNKPNENKISVSTSLRAVRRKRNNAEPPCMYVGFKRGAYL